DYKNLRRTLSLTVEIIEMKFPVLLNLNMEDEALERGIRIDLKKLSGLLGGVNVVATTAVIRKGFSELKAAMKNFVRSEMRINYPSGVVDFCAKLEALMPQDFKFKRPAALMLISGDSSVLASFSEPCREKIKKLIKSCDRQMLEKLSASIFSSREAFIDSVIKQVCVCGEAQPARSSFAYRFGLALTGIKFGAAAFVLVIALLYYFVGVFGAGTCVDFLEETIFNGYLSPLAVKFFKTFSNETNLIYRLFVGEFGLITMGLTYAVAIVLPIMFTFFFAFSFLEDSGYIPRLTVLSDRIFKHVGLNGKAVLPIILGFGCGTMAILTTRVLDTKKERLIATIILALGVPCSAQLGVMMGLSAKIAWYATLAVFITVFMQVVIVGKLSSYLIKGEPSLFLIELPPMRWPQPGNIFKKTYNRVIWYLQEVVPLFLIGTFVLFALSETGLLKIIENLSAPIITGMLGLPREATFAFLMGFLRRDYGAAGLYTLSEKGLLSPFQIMISLVVITLFIPCVASFFMIIKERGMKVSLMLLAFITPYAFFVGYVLRIFMSYCFPWLAYAR
ncbi:MAG TPA: ferrous iron transporter B, partial [Candidatus Wallbacteria bacterium]|nr:ferrous iron transporter B [Candidatus Wallbacteria bacterium]